MERSIINGGDGARKEEKRRSTPKGKHGMGLIESSV